MGVPLRPHPGHIGKTLLNRQCVHTDQRILHRLDVGTGDVGRRTDLAQTIDAGVGLNFDQRLNAMLFEVRITLITVMWIWSASRSARVVSAFIFLRD